MSGRPSGAALKRVESYQWPSGHIGHITENQSAALDQFKALCAERGYFLPASVDGEIPATHDDETLLRYLRARKFVPQEAFAQFKETEDWRKDNQLDALYETIDIQEYEQTRRLYPQWTGRRDKRGIPFYVYEVSQVDAKDLSAYQHDKDVKNTDGVPASQTPRKMLRLFALYENLCRFVLPLCSAVPDRPHGESPVSQCSNLVDLSKVGFMKFWGLKNHMNDASKLATAHYPETLDHIFVVGAPSFFPTLWDWAKRWFDPITVAKISILSEKNTKDTLAKYVDLDNVPKKYGGNLNWEFGDMPFLETEIAKNLRWKEDIKEKGHRTFPIGPVKWQYDADGDLVATAIGTEDGKPRRRVVAGLHPEDDVVRLALSPGRQDKNSLFVTASGAHQAKSPSTANGASVANGAAIAPAAAATSIAVGSEADLNEGKVAPPPSSDGRETSSTRDEQPLGTHAESYLEGGTPAVKVDPQGERQGIEESNTVGQAPQEQPLPNTDEDEHHSVIGQAKQMATHLPHSVLSAVGIGGKDEGEEKASKDEETKCNPEVERMEGKDVEEYLRDKTTSLSQR